MIHWQAKRVSSKAVADPKPQQESKDGEIGRMISTHGKMATQIVNEGIDLPKLNVSKAQSKFYGICNLRIQISYAIEDVIEKLDGIKALIEANQKNDENPDGLLTSRPLFYTFCLEIQKSELEVLLEQDVAYWKENLCKVRENSKTVKRRIEETLEKQNQDLEAVLTQFVNPPHGIL